MLLIQQKAAQHLLGTSKEWVLPGQELPEEVLLLGVFVQGVLPEMQLDGLRQIHLS